MSPISAFKTFIDPPREYGPIPFWFWNDDLQEDELLRQLHTFHQAGFGGVLPHARTGLSHRVGYLSDEYFRLMRRVVEEAARLEMKIILYDEGSYPSGTANGAVVAQNPDFTSLVLGKQPGGEHQLELRITNSMANAYEGVQSPSGLIGPVNLIYST